MGGDLGGDWGPKFEVEVAHAYVPQYLVEHVTLYVAHAHGDPCLHPLIFWETRCMYRVCLCTF